MVKQIKMTFALNGNANIQYCINKAHELINNCSGVKFKVWNTVMDGNKLYCFVVCDYDNHKVDLDLVLIKLQERISYMISAFASSYDYIQ